jgi:lipopolysaccharide export system protein LptA
LCCVDNFISCARWPKLLLLTLLGTIAVAIPLRVLALPEDSEQPIHIRADNAEIDNKSKRVIYRGSVQVDQGTLQVTADEMTVEYQDQKVVRIVATGQPARYKQQLEAEDELVNADASTIIYYTQDERVDLKGAASLEQQGNTVTGDFIRYDIVEGKIDATAEGDNRVRMELQPAFSKP